MDSVLEWDVSAKVDGLVETIVKCKQELTNHCFKMHGSAKAISSDAYASAKVIELLKLSEMCKPCVDETEDDTQVSIGRRAFKEHEVVADFASFKLHHAEVMTNEQVRLVVVFDVGTGIDQTWYGNVELND